MDEVATEESLAGEPEEVVQYARLPITSDDDVETPLMYVLRSDCSGMTYPAPNPRVQLLPMT